MEKTHMAVHTGKSVYHDAVAHTIGEWKEILKGMKVEFKFVAPFLLTEDNYEV